MEKFCIIWEPGEGEDEDFVGVFLPTTPNPTSGFLLYVNKGDIIYLDMTVEQAAKLVISAGLVTPDFVPEGEVAGREARDRAGGAAIPQDEIGQPARSSRIASSRPNR